MIKNKVVKFKIGKLLFLLGPFLLTAGLTIGIISEKWGIIPLSLLIIGMVICSLWLFFKLRESKWLENRSTQSGTNALIATLSVFIILGLINFLGDRYHLRLDLTDNQLFTLAPQSRELVANLSQPAKVWLFTREKNPQDQELLSKYSNESNKFEFEYIDPQLNPVLAKKFGVKQDGEVYLEFNNQQKLVQNINENESLSEVKLTSRLQQITSSTNVKIYFLQGHGETIILDSKESSPEAVQALNDRNFTTLPLNLTTQPQVPIDAAAVIVSGPQRGLLPGEVTALQTYLNNGGNLLLMLDPNKDAKIDSILKDWGISLDQRLVIDTSGESLGLGPAAILVTEYGQHPITKDFGNGISLYPLSRPLVITPVSNVESMTLLKTKPFPSSWAEIDQKTEKLEFNEGKDLKGPLTLGVALQKKVSAIATVSPTATPTNSPIPTPINSPTPTQINSPTPTPTNSPIPTPINSPAPTQINSPTPTPINSPTATPINSPAPTATPINSPAPTPINSPTPTPINSPIPTATPTNSINTPKESRLVVFGNSSFIGNNLFRQQLNADVFLNSVSWVSQQDQQPLSIRPKEQKNRRITISNNEANILTILAVFVLPLIGLIAGGIIWWIRR